jgi:hypothetical protein
MKHLRSDWDSIQPAPGETTIEDDEPVFLLRARDVVGADTVHDWAGRAYAAGADPAHCTRVHEWADEMEAWRQEHGGGHVPDVPEGRLR